MLSACSIRAVKLTSPPYHEAEGNLKSLASTPREMEWCEARHEGCAPCTDHNMYQLISATRQCSHQTLFPPLHKEGKGLARKNMDSLAPRIPETRRYSFEGYDVSCNDIELSWNKAW